MKIKHFDKEGKTTEERQKEGFSVLLLYSCRYPLSRVKSREKQKQNWSLEARKGVGGTIRTLRN